MGRERENVFTLDVYLSKLKIRQQYINRETHFPYILSTMIYNFVVQRANPANGQTTNCGNPSQYSSRHSVTSLEGEKHQNMENCREYSAQRNGFVKDFKTNHCLTYLHKLKHFLYSTEREGSG